MVRITTLTFWMWTGILCLCLTGCGSIPRVDPLGSGYEEVTYTQQSFSEPSAHQITLQYRKPSGGRIMIWPSVHGYIIKDDLAVFVGHSNFVRPKSGESWPMENRLFAVKSPELPLDITGEVLWRWCKKSGGDFKKTLENATIVYMEETNNVEVFHFGIWPNTDANISLNWNQISDIMREVKEKGVVRKDLRWGTSYIEKEFKPEPGTALSPAAH